MLLHQNMSQVVHLSTHDVTGGAAQAAHRLHLALAQNGVCRSRMVVRFKASDDPQVVAIPASRGLSARASSIYHSMTISSRLPTTRATFNLNTDPYISRRKLWASIGPEANVLYLHWITG